MIDLNPDTTHSPERTFELAACIDAAARTLVYATMPGRNGLRYPGDVHRVIGEVRSTVGRIPQLLGQLGEFLCAQRNAGCLRDDRGSNPVPAVAAAVEALCAAQALADALTETLAPAHNAIGHLAYDGPDDD
jgi:hypothetical protein